MAQGSGLTRGDRNRNRKIAALREVVRRDGVVLAVDLGEDKQAAVLVDQEGRVVARKVVRAKAWQLGGLVEWAGGLAARAGFAGLVSAETPICLQTAQRRPVMPRMVGGAWSGGLAE